MFIIKLKARKFSIPLIVLFLFIGLDAQTNNERLIEKKQRLQELLGLEPDGPLNEETYEILSQNLESLGIEDDELIDGYEFIGGYWGFQEYLDNNIDRLLKVLDDEGGAEFWEDDEEYGDDEEYADDEEYGDDEFEIDEFWYNDPEYDDSNDIQKIALNKAQMNLLDIYEIKIDQKNAFIGSYWKHTSYRCKFPDTKFKYFSLR